MTGRRVRVVLVDDHAGYRDALTSVLEASGRVDVVFRTATVEAAVEWLSAVGQADLVVSDLHLEGSDGLDLCRWVGARGAGPPVCIVTADARHAAAVEALGAGAAGFVHKSTDPEELTKLVLAAAAGEPAVDLATAGQLAAGRGGPGAGVPLSSRQLAVLRGLADGLGVDALCERTGLDEDGVRRLVSRTLDELGAPTDAAAVAWALRNRVIT